VTVGVLITIMPLDTCAAFFAINAISASAI
jgi:hypothetical protein